MQTKCPKCATIFKISEEVLSIADEQVRCSSCKAVFNGREHLIDSSQNVQTEKPADKAVYEFSITDIKRRIKGKSTSRLAYCFWLLAAFTSTTLLVTQILWLNKNKLAEHPKLGSSITTLCSQIPYCKIEDKRDSNAFSLSTRQIYSHPNEENALILSASFTNGANFAQPFPLLLVSMSDKQGNVIAERYFKPDEYHLSREAIPAALPLNLSANNKVLMQPSESININLTLVDPGKDALAFEIDFL